MAKSIPVSGKKSSKISNPKGGSQIGLPSGSSGPQGMTGGSGKGFPSGKGQKIQQTGGIKIKDKSAGGESDYKKEAGNPFDAKNRDRGIPFR